MKFLILAGGGGTRLYPLSREKMPKQFLTLVSEKSLLQETVARLHSDSFVVVTNKQSYYQVKRQLEEMNKNSSGKIVCEPVARNTAPAIIYGLTAFQDNDIIAVLPADHYIKYTEKFLALLTDAEKYAHDSIVTIGIKPHYPETGFGYIKKSDPLEQHIFHVEKFVEKPDYDTAMRYLVSGEYIWNAGMFVFSKKLFLQELQTHAPELYALYESFATLTLPPEKIYADAPSVSIDYGLMEKTQNIITIEADFGWSDIGSWKALKDLKSKREENVVMRGTLLEENSSNNIIYSEKPVVNLIDVHDKIIIDTNDILLVCDMKSAQKVKNACEATKEKFPQRVAAHPNEQRPWGEFHSLKESDGFKVKWIKVSAGEKLSLQYHHHREEHWTIVSGKALMTLGDKTYEVRPGNYVYIPKGEKHTIEGIEDTEFIEVQRGDYLGEDDIVRLDDKYNR